jgi:hypothetical protein
VFWSGVPWPKMRPMERFKVITGGSRPRSHRARKRGEAEQLTCPRCDAAVTVEVRLGRMIRDGKPEGGTRAIVCAVCLSKGTVTRLI